MTRRPPPTYIYPGEYGHCERHPAPRMTWPLWIAYAVAVGTIGTVLALWIGIGP